MLKGIFSKRGLVAVGVGMLISLITWAYLNSYYTLGVEDELLNKIVFFKHKLIKMKPRLNKQFVFISTGKDLSLIDDTAGYGNIAVSDRYKLYQLLKAINNAPDKPKFILLDLQFYNPYISASTKSLQNKLKEDPELKGDFPDKWVDDSLRFEVERCKNMAITVLAKKAGIDTPLYKSSYGVADYTTYGNDISKFRINYGGTNISSIPALLHQKIDGAVYKSNRFAAFCNNKLCFSYLWPDYYYDEADVKQDSTYQEYHLGAILPMVANPPMVSTLFKDKIVFVGNFEADTHGTPAGNIPGTIVIADIYLSLLNGKHYAPTLWLIFVWITFTILSYMAIYAPIPEVGFKFGFAFAEQIGSFIKEYISYIGILFIISIISVFVFGITISLFLPAFIFSGIDFFIQKKYKSK